MWFNYCFVFLQNHQYLLHFSRKLTCFPSVCQRNKAKCGNRKVFCSFCNLKFVHVDPVLSFNRVRKLWIKGIEAEYELDWVQNHLIMSRCFVVSCSVFIVKGCLLSSYSFDTQLLCLFCGCLLVVCSLSFKRGGRLCWEEGKKFVSPRHNNLDL